MKHIIQLFRTTLFLKKNMKKILLLLILICLTYHIQAQIVINNHTVYYDSKTNTWLASIPETMFGKDCQLTVTAQDGWNHLTIDNEFVDNQYRFKQITAESTYQTSITDADGNTITGVIQFTFLPVIHLLGEFENDYHQGKVTISIPEQETDIILNANIKWRGGSTNKRNKHKRNYKLKFDDDYQFFELRNDNNWILDAGQADLFRLRNRIAMDIWNDMVSKPYYINQEPKALSGVRGQVVEVFLNDDYRGIYNFSENMDRKQLKLKKYDKSTGEIHGELWKSKGHNYTLMWKCPDDYDNKSDTWYDFEIKYPDIEDLEETDWSTLWNAINFVANSSDDEFSQEVADYFDIPVLIDYYVFLETLAARDNVGKNVYWAVYDKAKDKKLTLAIWDLDGTTGAKWLEEKAGPEVEMDYSLKVLTNLMTVNFDHFYEKANKRYHELRNNLLSTENLIKRYTDYYKVLKTSGAAKREEKKWSGDTDVKKEEINFDKEIAYITDWITRRMPYLDRDIFPESFSNITNISKESVNDNKLYNLNGQVVNEKIPLRKGIYIRNGRKIIIK